MLRPTTRKAPLAPPTVRRCTCCNTPVAKLTAPTGEAEKRPPHEWAALAGVSHFHVSILCGLAQWEPGCQVTRDEFDEACEAAKHISLR